MGPSGGLMLDGDLLAYSSMAISLFSSLFLVAIHTHEGCLPTNRRSRALSQVNCRSVLSLWWMTWLTEDCRT